MLAQPIDDALDAGPRQAARGTERLCASTGTVQPVDDMIRFVVSPDGTAVPDLKRRLPGRGIWITATRSALAPRDRAQGICAQLQARRARRARSRRRDRAPAGARRARRARDRLQGRAGGDRVSPRSKRHWWTAMRSALLHASDAAPDGVRKLNAALRRNTDGDRSIAVLDVFTSAQLDLALGRSNVVHAALLAGPESKAFLTRLPRAWNDFGPERSGTDPLKAREMETEWLKRRKRLAKRS